MQPSNNLKSSFFSLIRDDTPHLALYTSAPTATGGGTEVTGGSYSRQPITFGAPNLTTNLMQNTNAINFSAMPTANITSYGILDSATSGNLLSYGPISAISTLNGDEVSVAVGNITVTFAGS